MVRLYTVGDWPSRPRKRRGKKVPERGEYIFNFITYPATLNWLSLVPARTPRRTVHLDPLPYNPPQLQLRWVEPSGGRAVINLNLLNCH